MGESSVGGGALPVILSIIGPRETHDYRNYNLIVRGINSSKKTPQKRVHLDADAGLEQIRPLYLKARALSAVRAVRVGM